MQLKDRAEQAYRKAIEVRPGYWIGYNRLGAFYYRNGRYREAAEQFRRVVQLTPDNAQGYSSLGVMLMNLRELAEAQQMLESAVRLAPQVPAYHNNLANLHFRRESYPEAAKAYAKALDLDKSNYKIWANLGRSYDQMAGHQDKAKDAYRQAAQLAERVRTANPNNGVVLSELANFYALLGKVSEPLELLGTALSLAPGDRWVVINAAEAYEVLGFRDQALKWLEKAIQLGIQVDEIKRTPTLKQLVKDSRFEALLKNSK
jgi:serine/threonine-protein kinase